MESLTDAEVVGRTLAALGVRDAFGALGSGNFLATQALRAAGEPPTRATSTSGACSTSAPSRWPGCTRRRAPATS